MIQQPANRLGALAFCVCAFFGIAHADDPLPAVTRMVAAAGAAPPTQVLFSIATAQDLVVTLTDLKIPAAVASAGIVVTQGGAIAASAQLAPPATMAMASLPAASGQYTLFVFGVPDASFSVAAFTVCVAPKASPSNCIQSASTAGFITVQSSAKDPTVSTLSETLTVTTPGSYTFTFGDLAFPVALATAPNLALFQPGSPLPLVITSGTPLTLNAGTYQLLAIAQADQTVKSGLYNVTTSGPSGSAPLLDTVVPVGTTPVGAPFKNPSAQNVIVTVTDYGFPGALASASALLTSGGTVIGTANAAGGAATLAAPAGSLNLWTYANPGATAGTFSVDVAGSTDLYTTAHGVSPAGGTSAYAFVTPPLTAGAYQATVGDLQFPSQLSALSFAVAQNAVILKQSTTAAALAFNAAAGNAILLVSAQAPGTGSATGIGLFDVNVQSTGASAQLIFDKTQNVGIAGALFDSQTLTLGVNSSFDAMLTDLKFPNAFGTLDLVISRGTDIQGKIYGGGKFSFSGSPGTYQLTFVATPSASQSYGLYAASIVFSAPTVSLTSNVATASAGSPVMLTWTATNAISCSASGAPWTGSKATATTSEAVQLSATTTFTLTCTGSGGTASQSVTVTATPAKSGGGGGGAMDPFWLFFGSGLLLVRMRRGQQQADSRAN